MMAPRLDIDLEKIYFNAYALVTRLGRLGISVMGVSKAFLGEPNIANTMLQAGVVTIGDSRIENIQTMIKADIKSPMTLIRSPRVSQVDRVVHYADISFNTELEVIKKLSSSAKNNNCTHGVILMVELGDLREGIMPENLEDTVRKVRQLPNIVLKGIGTNLGCRNGVIPDSTNMAELSRLVGSIESTFGMTLEIVSGGNSGSLEWALGGSNDIGRVNQLRLGESILLGVEPLNRTPIEGLYTDAITLVAEVIESKSKPTLPWGETAQSTFGDAPVNNDRGNRTQTILAVGRQDIDHNGLLPPKEIEILGASSDHLILSSEGETHRVGTEMRFDVNYSALLRAMTSPFVSKVIKKRKS